MRTQREFLKEAGRTLYPIDFNLGYLDKSHIKVFTNPEQPNVELSYTWLNENQIQLAEPFLEERMYIRRIVPKDVLWVDFEDGSRLNEKNLDDANRQCLMAVEEVLDGFFDDVYLQKLEDLVAEATEQFEKAKAEADRSKNEADRSKLFAEASQSALAAFQELADQVLEGLGARPQRDEFLMSEADDGFIEFVKVTYDPEVDFISVFLNGSKLLEDDYELTTEGIQILEHIEFDGDDELVVINIRSLTLSLLANTGKIVLNTANDLANIEDIFAVPAVEYSIQTLFNFGGEQYGGGDFEFQPTMSKQLHNGWSVIALGATGNNWVDFNAWTGTGTGCFVRKSEHDSPTKRIKASLFNKMASGFKVIAHRANRLSPENTIAGLYDLPRNCFGVEIDTRITADGQIVLMHDSTVNRTTNGSGSVSSLTLNNLKDLDAGSWVHPFYSETKVPTLKEFLVAAFEHGIELVIVQAKVLQNTTHAQAYVDIVEELNCWDKVVIGDSPTQFINLRRVTHKVLGVTFSNSEAQLADRIKLMVGLQGSIALTPPNNVGFENNQAVYQAMFEQGVISGTSTLNSIERIRQAQALTAARFCLTDLYDHAKTYEV